MFVQPIAGDENPETYGVPIASLHTDHVAADNTRRINYIYVPSVRPVNVPIMPNVAGKWTADSSVSDSRIYFPSDREDGR